MTDELDPALEAFLDAMQSIATEDAPSWREQRARDPEQFDREAAILLHGLEAFAAARISSPPLQWERGEEIISALEARLTSFKAAAEAQGKRVGNLAPGYVDAIRVARAALTAEGGGK